MTVEHENLMMAAPEDLPDSNGGAMVQISRSVMATNRYPTINLYRTIPKIFKTQYAGGLAEDPSLAAII